MDNKPSNGLPMEYMTRDMFASLMSAQNILDMRYSQACCMQGRAGLREKLSWLKSELSAALEMEYKMAVNENYALRQELLENGAGVVKMKGRGE